MTREEAIFCEKSYIGETNCTDCKYYGTKTCQSRESHKMAIKALELEPCCNCIEFKRYAKEMGFEIEQEPKTGHWEHIKDKFGRHFIRCGCCKYTEPEYITFSRKYCPNCGAKMDVPDNNVGEMGGEQE